MRQISNRKKKTAPMIAKASQKSSLIPLKLKCKTTCLSTLLPLSWSVRHARNSIFVPRLKK